jgi:transposase
MEIPLDYARNNRRLGQHPSDLLLLTRVHGKAGEAAFPDESLFGILSRHHVLSGHLSSGVSMIELIGRRTASPSTAFPSDMRAMLAHLKQPASNVEDLVQRHTILPYFRLFVSSSRYRTSIGMLVSGAAAASKISLGLVASRIGAADQLRYCPICAHEDEALVGVATWYRVHQLPGVLVCPYHGVSLMESDCLSQRLGRLQLFLPDAEGMRFYPAAASRSSATWSKLLLVSRLSAQTLVADVRMPSKWSLRACYATHLLQQGLAMSLSRIRQRELQDQFLDYWAPLQAISPFCGMFQRHTMDSFWLASLCRKSRCSHHPLKHLLLIGFIEDDLASFLHPPAIALPDTTQPKLRPDRLGRQLKALIVTQGMSAREAAQALHISTNTALVHAQRAKIPVTRRSKKMTPALHDRASAALANGISVRKIAEQLMLSMSTINRLLGENPDLRQARLTHLAAARRQRARDRILAVLHRSPAIGSNALRAQLPADYTWLYRHDRKWLQQHVCPAKRRPTTSHVDWSVRDEELCRQVRCAAQDIIHFTGKPIRVTRNEIGRRTRHSSWLEKSLEKLPKTKKLLPTVLESTAVFQQRRYLWWQGVLSGASLDGCVPDWRIRRAAGIRHDDACRNQSGT